MQDSHENHKKWLVVVNPHAGSNKCKKDWPKIEKLLQKMGQELVIVFTERQNHAMELVISHTEENGMKNIIVVGGDGTLNEAVNGIFKQKKYPTDEITLGLVSVGTGNDWGRTYEMPDTYSKQVKMIQKGHTTLQDVGQVEFRFSEDKEKRHFINMAGMGYDALVAQKTNLSKQQGKGGTISYLLNLVTGLFQYKSIHLDIEADGKKVFSGKVFSMSLGVCKYNGGGMMQLPDAVPDDGILDMTIIRKTTKYRIVTNLKNLYDGSFVMMPEVEQHRGKTVTITSKPARRLYLETDGESLGHSPLLFTVIPKSARMIVRKKYSVIN
jgi:YegS/Rv2252/BmrU family lipid kinase